MIKAYSKRKLSRPNKQRKILLRNLSFVLVMNEKVCTTLPKAKELKNFIEKLITIAKKGRGEVSYRRIKQDIKNSHAIKKLFDVIGPRYSDRNGGYTQIFRLGYRKGDLAPMAILKLIQ